MNKDKLWDKLEKWFASQTTEAEAVKTGYSLGHNELHSHVEIFYARIENHRLITSKRDLEIKTLVILSDDTIEVVLKDILQTLRQEAE